MAWPISSLARPRSPARCVISARLSAASAGSLGSSEVAARRSTWSASASAVLMSPARAEILDRTLRPRNCVARSSLLASCRPRRAHYPDSSVTAGNHVRRIGRAGMTAWTERRVHPGRPAARSRAWPRALPPRRRRRASLYATPFAWRSPRGERARVRSSGRWSHSTGIVPRRSGRARPAGPPSACRAEADRPRFALSRRPAMAVPC